MGTLAANVSGPLSYTGASTLTVGIIDATNGVSTGGANITLKTGDLLTLANQVTATGAIVDLNSANGVNQSGGSVTANQLLLKGTGTFTLTDAANAVNTVAGALTSGAISYTNSTNLQVGVVQGVAGISTGGGNVTLTANGVVTVNQVISTQSGGGGTLSINGGVTLNATPLLGNGNITLAGSEGPNADIIIATNLTLNGSFDIQTTRDIIIQAAIQTLAGGNIALTADSGLDGVGGVWVTSTGSLNAAGSILLSGSDVFATPSSFDSVRIDGNGSNQLMAGGTIVLQDSGTPQEPTDADIIVNSNLLAIGGIAITAFHDVQLGGSLAAMGGVITLASPVLLTANTAVSSDGGAINFLGTVDAGPSANQPDLSLDAQAGNIDLAGSLGSMAPPGASGRHQQPTTSSQGPFRPAASA